MKRTQQSKGCSEQAPASTLSMWKPWRSRAPTATIITTRSWAWEGEYCLHFKHWELYLVMLESVLCILLVLCFQRHLLMEKKMLSVHCLWCCIL
uniref:Uncharacterized protein n=1 Tax=Salix viminalis TaxID=40686 RepID=A0A6N2MKA9_SALVM